MSKPASLYQHHRLIKTTTKGLHNLLGRLKTKTQLTKNYKKTKTINVIQIIWTDFKAEKVHPIPNLVNTLQAGQLKDTISA